MLGQENDLLIRVLQIFESLIAPGATTHSEATQAYPRQHALNRAWGHLRQGSADARLDFATRCLRVKQPFMLQDYDESFAAWEEDVVARYPEDGAQLSVDDCSPLNKSRTEPSYAVWRTAQSLFKALAASTKCQCRPAHELGASLCLGTYRKPQLDDRNCFAMFLASGQYLQEAHVHIVNDSVVRFVVGDQAQPMAKKMHYRPMVVNILCEQIAKMQKMASQRLELKVERGRLLKLRSERSSFRIDKKRLPVPLQHFIREEPRSLTEKTKRILAVLLSYALLHLHGTPWLQPTWDSSQILFFYTQSSTIPLRPFIHAQLSGRQVATGLSDLGRRDPGAGSVPFDDGPDHLDPDELYPANLDPDDVKHPLPALVTFAVMLMELHFATPFQVLASNRGMEIPEGQDSCRGQLLTPTSGYTAAKFYDNERPSGAHPDEQLKSYLIWKADCRSVYKKYIDPYLQDPPQSPVKVAILDSGVDETHNALKTGQIKLKRNWTSKIKKAVHDRDGHGTFTASLVVDYAPDVELYIAKIADKALCPPAVIAEAIKTAVDDWHVDVVSMSFGYPTNKIDGYGELEKALLHAHSRNVLMFAAASNSGANLDRAYPARDPHVICIHSTDSHGNRSKFSPTALARDANLATIGEAIQSAWPVGLSDIDANPDCVQCKSGTSYATPIAVGIAAFLLQYARIHLAETAHLLKRQSRMKDVLLKVAEKTQHSICRDDYNYVALSLFEDNLFGNEKEVIDVTLGELLRR
ncbi:subtilase family protein [Hirsutella rhossiliensis]|uniref:Subtilase family domain-containing protein n=1 Tax=Hirsutella rhossiliensis TaxID=111463 RepID=A0A9P8MX81_9HYPO|nr:subtilase family domain-containing protein [Hirsutella rhossiliensis]KAH0962895.1 subtilase family domain-containing protein [Hirsutella rhossiliensis]